MRSACMYVCTFLLCCALTARPHALIRNFCHHQSNYLPFAFQDESEEEEAVMGLEGEDGSSEEDDLEEDDDSDASELPEVGDFSYTVLNYSTTAAKSVGLLLLSFRRWCR